MKSKLFILGSLCLALTACEQHVTHKDGTTTREVRPGTATDASTSQNGRGTVNPNNPNYNADSANRNIRND